MIYFKLVLFIFESLEGLYSLNFSACNSKFFDNFVAILSIRYPRGGSCETALPLPAPLSPGKAEVLKNAPEGPVIWALGAECGHAEKVCTLLEAQGITPVLINIRFVVPFDRETALKFVSRHHFVIEDHGTGGAGSCLCEIFASHPDTQVTLFNWGSGAVGHGDVAELRRRAGLDPESIAGKIAEIVREKGI